MSSLDDLLNNSGLTSEQIGVIRSLISDWQLIADLTFSDLVLWVPQRGDSKSWPMGHRAVDRKSTRLNSSHVSESRMPSSA